MFFCLQVIQHGRHRGKLRSSTVHGWLVKMRGTIVGDEKMRWRGIEEMKSASRHRQRNASSPPPPPRRNTSSRKGSSGGMFSSLFGTTKKPSGRGGKGRHGGGRAPRRAQTMPVKRIDNRPHASRRPSANSRRPSANSRRPSQGSRQPSQTSKRRANTR